MDYLEIAKDLIATLSGKKSARVRAQSAQAAATIALVEELRKSNKREDYKAERDYSTELYKTE